nr:extracellular serine/threonine protein kinase FAM20C-like isoform X1 [Biomphalaria glabrata]
MYAALVYYHVETLMKEREVFTRCYTLDHNQMNLESPNVKNNRGSRSKQSVPEADMFIQEYTERADIINSIYQLNKREHYHVFLSRLKERRKEGKRMAEYLNIEGNETWLLFQRDINQFYLYNPADHQLLNELLKDLNSRPVVKAEINRQSSQLVLILTLDDGGKGVFKPMRMARDAETSDDLYYFSEMERHISEIAAFHLDKVLGFYRAPPTIGRILNITRDIQQVGEETLTNTVYRSPVGNVCFYGKCKNFCDPAFAVCGQPDGIQGSISAFLPSRSFHSASANLHHPWSRSYNMKLKQGWETNEEYCETSVKGQSEFKGRRLLDFMDTSVFDFLIGNMDRHNVEFFSQFGADTFLLHYDHGRGFGKSKYDCMSCLAPVRQCCLIRLSTLAKLIKLYNGPDSLSHVLQESLKADPLAPILWERHLDALDRRVGLIIKVISECITRKRKLWQEVIVDDGVI